MPSTLWRYPLLNCSATLHRSQTPRGNTIELESHFDFLAPDDIPIKGTRIGIETLLYEYLH
jgi:hypothetical protein